MFSRHRWPERTSWTSGSLWNKYVTKHFTKPIVRIVQTASDSERDRKRPAWGFCTALYVHVHLTRPIADLGSSPSLRSWIAPGPRWWTGRIGFLRKIVKYVPCTSEHVISPVDIYVREQFLMMCQHMSMVSYNLGKFLENYFWTPPGPPPYQFCTWILQKVF